MIAWFESVFYFFFGCIFMIFLYILFTYKKDENKNNQNKQNNKNSKKSVLDLEINKKIQLMEKEDILYHLLTDKTTFSVENTVFYDYNAGIDTCLEK